MDQNNIFLRSEGDAWYARNQGNLQEYKHTSKSPDVRYICETLHPFKNKINTILEVGCSNGIKLEVICNSLSAKGSGIDPSKVAVEAGNERNKVSQVSLAVGSAEKVPFEVGTFEFVYFSFCLYLVDRNMLMLSLAEADRVLKPGGFLAITDFDSGMRQKRSYSHFEGIFSYKQDYSTFYTQSGLYYLLGKNSFSHSSEFFDERADERISTTILYKELDACPLQNK